MPTPSRASACLAALLALANCSSASEPVRSARDAAPAAPDAARASGAETDCLAEAIYFEARGTGDAGREAVAHVVVNRAQSPLFPDTVCGVVADGCQFSYRCDGGPEALTDPRARGNAIQTARAVLGGSPDITRGALFFHSARAVPGWFQTRARVGDIGGNIFYR